jgi:hypothetical protein
MHNRDVVASRSVDTSLCVVRLYLWTAYVLKSWHCMSAHHKDESVMRVMPAQETSVVLSSCHLCQFTLTFNHPQVW